MRLLAALLLVALPAFAGSAADGPAYDDALLDTCLNGIAAEQPDFQTEPLRACIGQAAAACMEGEGGATTVGMVACLSAEAREWDMIQTAYFSRVLGQVETADAELAQMGSAAPPAAPALQQAQDHWAAFRDASCEYEALRFQGGTAGGPAAAACLLDLTATQALRMMDRARGME